MINKRCTSLQQWVYLGPLENESELDDFANTQSNMVFNLDTYKLLMKELNKPNLKIIEFD
jgi:DNA polymerase-3 subunit epsilon